MLHFTPDRRGLILKAALDVFSTYGFRKTSMDDIARAAGVSRPALYQLFRNKTDIFRAVSLATLDYTINAATHVLDSKGPFEQRITEALDVSVLAIHRQLEQSPHGPEIIVVNDEIASDIDELWAERMAQLIARAFEEAAEAGEIDLRGVSGAQLAKLFIMAIKGIHDQLACGQGTEKEIRSMIDVLLRLTRKA
jgi:AcrR family transcriptional regulator